MQFYKSKKFRITEGLAKSNNFVANVDNEIIRITKNLSEKTLYSSYFKCIIVTELGIHDSFMIDELVFNNHTGRINFLNNRKIGDHIVSFTVINDNTFVSLYPFEEDTILVVFDDMEMMDYDTN